MTLHVIIDQATDYKGLTFIHHFTHEYESTQVIGGIMELLNLRIRPFVRIDLLQTTYTQALSFSIYYLHIDPSFY